MNRAMFHLGISGLILVCLSVSLEAANKPKASASPPDLVQTLLESEPEAANASIDRRESLKPASRPQADPSPVWWQAGYLQSGKQWRPFEDCVTANDDATLLNEYRSERNKLTGKPHGQWQLATWCRKNGLLDQERVHLLQVLADRDPQVNADAVYERLGYQLVGNSWVSPEERRVTAELAAHIEGSHKQWDMRIRSIGQLLKGTAKQRVLGEKQLGEITDSSAVPVIVEGLCLSDQPSAELGVRTLGQIPDYQSSRALAGQAVFSPWRPVRSQAVELLKLRKLEEFVPDLVLLMSYPIRTTQDRTTLSKVLSNAKPIGIPEMNTNWDCAWIEETHDTIRIGIRRLIPVSSAETIGQWQISRTSQEASAVVIAMYELSQQADLVKYTAEKMNESRTDLNERVGGVLSKTTGRPMSADPNDWNTWWASFANNSIVSEKSVRIVDERPPMPRRHHSCLVAGTPVWTECGFVAIEQIRPGDRVLSKEIGSGELSYKPVLMSTMRDPTPVQTFRVGDDSIQASLGHHFWASGDGWTKTRELIPQLPLHTATGMLRITSVEDEGRSEKVYNLVVADFHTYFVGRSMVLSHDVTTPALTNIKVPGLTVK